MTFLYDIMRSILDFIQLAVPSYGWCIVLFTLLIRILLLPLDIKSKRSMKRMSEVQPKIAALQKKYAKDQDKLNQKTQELYRSEKINPLSGCLPMLIQLPILFAMLGVMRQVANEQTILMIEKMASGIAPEQLQLEGWLWIKNIWQPDSFMSTIIPLTNSLQAITPVGGNLILTQERIDLAKAFVENTGQYMNYLSYFGADKLQFSAPMLLWTISIPMQMNGFFILPILAGASQFLSTKLTPMQQPQPSADGQQKPMGTGQFMTYFFPLFSVWICASSTAAFSIYWVAANLIQIVQTFALNAWMDHQDKKKTTTSPEEV